MSELSISTSAFNFWTGFYPQDYDGKDVNLELCRWAGKKAYLDMNRTLNFIVSTKDAKDKKTEKSIAKTREGLRNQAIEKMFDHFKEVNEDYDEWHNNICKNIIKIYCEKLKTKSKEKIEKCDMTVGQAQKWVNMTVKYIWLVCSVYGTSDIFHYYENLMKQEKYFHIPLDHYILDYVKLNCIDKDENLSEEIKNGLTAIKKVWSAIPDFESYNKYQEALRKLIMNEEVNYHSPLEWELVHWHEAIKSETKRIESKNKAKEQNLL